MPWSDGTTRCTPGGAQTSDVRYLDAGCQVLASRTPDRILRSRDTSCGNATVLRSRAVPITASLFHLAGGACVADGLPAGPVFPIDVVVNATDLIEMTATTGLLTFDHVVPRLRRQRRWDVASEQARRCAPRGALPIRVRGGDGQRRRVRTRSPARSGQLVFRR